MTRKAMSKTLRFEVFKRDAFLCQYCGAHPPSVILVIDHIRPVADGGGNEIDNLITACESCNQGKAARSLTSIPTSLADKAAMVAEREAQIHGYQRVMEDKRLRIEDEGQRVLEIYETYRPGFTLLPKGMVSVYMFIEKLGVHEVMDAMQTACTTARAYNEFKYFCGICWNRIRGGH